MPESFNISQFVNKSQDQEFLKKLIPSYEKTPTNTDEEKGIFSKYNTRLWLSFYFALISSIILSAVVIEQSGIATSIMNRVRLAQKKSGTAPIPDLSSFTINTSPGMVALVKFPNGEKSGEDSNNVRFFEAENVSMTSAQAASSSASWTLFAKKPKSGKYQVDFYSNSAEDNTFNYSSYNRIGDVKTEYSYTLDMNRATIVRYHFYFDKDDPSQTKFLDYQKIVK